METRRKAQLQREFAAVEVMIQKLFDEDTHPVNNSSISSMSDFLDVIELSGEEKLFSDIETEEQLAIAATEFDQYVIPDKKPDDNTPENTL